nr:tyrosine-type recombinase/integrase [uncultured Brevundimonas sp.]
MARPRSAPRLRLKKIGVDTRGRPIRVWYIRDGAAGVSTGARESDLAGAEAALAVYLDKKLSVSPPVAERLLSPAEVPVADVISLYLLERAPFLADPGSAAARFDALLKFFGPMSLAGVTRSVCQAYVAQRVKQPVRTFKDPAKARRVSEQAATRELEDLSAAISWWDAERPLTRKMKVWRPTKPESPRDALTRHEAARLLKAAMGRRLSDQGWTTLSSSARANRRHLRRLVLIGLYTGTRPGVLVRLKWSPSDTDPWVDLEGGWLRRRGRLEKDQPTKRRPICRLPRRLSAHLHRWRDLDKAENLVRATQGQGPADTVLHHGGRALSGRIRRSFASAVTDAGLNHKVTPHWLRHTAATWLVAHPEVPLSDAAQFLGMTVDTLLAHYNHHRPDHQVEAAAFANRRGASR